jgi:predicted DNA binding CopG/RHH family protein
VKRKTLDRSRLQKKRKVKTSLTVRLTDEALQIVRDEAEAQGLSQTSIVEMAIRDYGRARGKL